MPEHEINATCAASFAHLNDAHGEILRRTERLERVIEGNGKPGLLQDVSDLRNDMEAVCQSNDRIEETLDKFVKKYEASNEGDKNRGIEIKKVLLQNGGQMFLAVVQLIMLYWFWKNTGIVP